jgi:predicted RNA-binding protein with PUA-like domain
VATSVAGRFALFAGEADEAVPSDIVDIYDSLEEKWSQIEMSQPRYYLTSVSLGNLAFFVDGRSEGRLPSNVVDIFDSTTQRWSNANLSQARYFLASASIGDTVAFGGGNTCFKYSAIVDFYMTNKNGFLVKSVELVVLLLQQHHQKIK